jgi:glycosyltransferase involved in cell wall biosynthesis
MRIEAVVICVNYADFLAATLPHNKYIFDKLVVVTSHKDEDVAHICEVYHIECIKTNIFDNGFNKGAGINLGLSRLSREDWCVQIDADCVLPSRARFILEIAKLREDTIYGCHRAMCPSYEDWCRYLAKPTKHFECDIYLHNKWPWPLGTQIGKLSKHPGDTSDLGFVPIGFFQAFHAKSFPNRKYPEIHTSAARSDLAFAYQWERKCRAIIPELTLIHLATPDQIKMGINWESRRSMRFGPEPF